MTPTSRASFPVAPSPAEDAGFDSIARVMAGWRATRPELRVEPIAITARLARLNAVLAPRLEAVFRRFGLRGADFALLAALVRLGSDQLPQRRLGSELGLSAGTVSVRVDRLVRQGLVRREPDPADGRGARIQLTERGRELFEACAPEHLANARGLLAGLSEHECDQLGVLLGKLLSTLEEPDANGRLTPELGLVVESAPLAVQRRRAAGLSPLPGLLVRHVDPSGQAAAGGVRPGDLLTSANRRPLRSHHDLLVALTHARRRRRALAVEVMRGTEPVRLRLATASGGS